MHQAHKLRENVSVSVYIKSASDRVYLQQQVLFAAESSSETAPHKQRNKRWRDITHPLDKRKMCCGR